MERIACTHKGTYADDCLCERVRQHKCYIVATCDKDLRRRIRKVCGESALMLDQLDSMCAVVGLVAVSEPSTQLAQAVFHMTN